jgi:hypothetical protein
MIAREMDVLANLGSLVLGFWSLVTRQKLLLGYLQVLDVGGETVQKRNVAGLLVGDWENALEATVGVPDLVTPPLFRLDALVKDFLAATVIDALEMNE